MLAYVLLNGTRFTCKDEAPKWHVLEANLGPGSIEVKDGHAIGGLGYIRARSHRIWLRGCRTTPSWLRGCRLTSASTRVSFVAYIPEVVQSATSDPPGRPDRDALRKRELAGAAGSLRELLEEQRTYWSKCSGEP